MMPSPLHQMVSLNQFFVTFSMPLEMFQILMPTFRLLALMPLNDYHLGVLNGSVVRNLTLISDNYEVV